MNIGRWLPAPVLAAVVLSAGPVLASFGEGDNMIRPPCCAGTWYPGSAKALAQTVDDLLAQAPPLELSAKPVALVAPHAGYRYSAPVAAAAYRALAGQSYKRVIGIAFSHQFAGSYTGIDVPAKLTAYDTPLGQVSVDREACNALLKKPGFAAHPGVDRDEHSLELQLPFLQRTLKDFRLVPLLVGRMSDRDYVEAAQALSSLVDPDTLIVVSSDFTHYGVRYGYEPFRDNVAERLRELADSAAKPLLACDPDGFAAHLARTDDTICGRGPITLLLRTLSMHGGATGHRAAFDTSGRMTDDWSTSVSYQSFVFTWPAGILSAEERSELLRLARQTATAFLKNEKSPEPDAAKLSPALQADGACFVTLQNHGELRGCIGNMTAEGPLYQAVMRNAVAACQDRRFLGNPVTAKEMDQIDIEISHLTPMKKVERHEDIVIGRHGLLIGVGFQRGVLLPQVAYERGWSREEFLAQTCRKAGLPPDAWKQANAELYSFEAEVFGER